MTRFQLCLLVPALALAVCGRPGTVRAQADEDFSLDEPDATGKAPPPAQVRPAPGPEAPPELLGDEQALEEERAPQERFRETTDPYEDPSKRYMFLGAGWRFIQMPSWLLKPFTVESGPSVGTPSTVFGELAFRRKGFQVLASVGFVNWNFEGAFQLKDDPIEDTEWLEGKLKVVPLTAAITWSTSFADWFQLEYGLEAGVAFVFGDVIRSEAYRSNGSWDKCPTWASQTTNDSDRTQFNPDFPMPTRDQRLYCDPPIGAPGAIPPDSNAADEEGAHYGVKAKRGLTNGGIPRMVPVLGPRLSLRFKPIHQLVLRVDVPLPVLPFGFMGGVSAQYGF